jgi:hypothetical protein
MKENVKEQKEKVYPYGSLAAYEAVLKYNSKELQDAYYKSKHIFRRNQASIYNKETIN